jgi:hypothetical protein
MGFREFVSEDSDAVIAQMRKIRNQMSVIRMKRALAREKESLDTMKREKRGAGIDKHRYT